MTNRLQSHFQNNSIQKRSALILYATAGDPSLKITGEFLWHCQKSGVDVVELGIPFSDPLADGPVIQASSFRAVKKGVSLKSVLHLIQTERAKGLSIPIVLMSSVTPLIAQGVKKCAKQMKSAGVDGIILPDLPIDEDLSVRSVMSDAGLSCIQMLTPTTDPVRRTKIIRDSSGFIYYVAVIGLTGKQTSVSSGLKKDVIHSQKKTDLPVCVGFGISNAAQVKAVSRYAKGVIVGTAIVENLAQYSHKKLSDTSKRFINSLVKAVR